MESRRMHVRPDRGDAGGAVFGDQLPSGRRRKWWGEDSGGGRVMVVGVVGLFWTAYAEWAVDQTAGAIDVE